MTREVWMPDHRNHVSNFKLDADGTIWQRVPVPAADLPEGVERISDGTLWLRAGDDVPTYAAPDGYEWLTFSGEWSTKSMPYGMRPCMVQVRPIPAPATEKVPWYEAVGRKLRPPHDCPIVKVGCSIERGPWAVKAEKARGATNFVDADGMVEVLVAR